MARLSFARTALLALSLVLLWSTFHVMTRHSVKSPKSLHSEPNTTQDSLDKLIEPFKPPPHLEVVPHAADEDAMPLVELHDEPVSPSNHHTNIKPYHYKNGADFNIAQHFAASGKANAVFVSLVNDNQLYHIIASIRSVEDRFNRKYHYDWVFLSDQPFSQSFIDLTSGVVSGKTKYGTIPKLQWLYPEWIDRNRAKELRQVMKAQGIPHGDLESFRHKSRFQLGFFWQSELLQTYEWYWRIDPGIEIHCDVDYDVFRFMQENRFVYGVGLTIHEFATTIPTLWQKTAAFLLDHPQHYATDNAMRFLSDDAGLSHNLCQFYSSFQIANLNFYRSQAFRDYFEYLDKSGGFFYERWGDSLVHSIAASLFLGKDKVHYFGDIGYSLGSYTQCPLEARFRYRHKCTCAPAEDFTFRSFSCGTLFHDVFDVKLPKSWKKYT